MFAVQLLALAGNWPVAALLIILEHVGKATRNPPRDVMLSHAAGFADFPLIAFHFARTSTVSSTWIPVFYAVAMGVGGMGSLVFGRLFDRVGLFVLIPLTLLSALFAPLVFTSGGCASISSGRG